MGVTLFHQGAESTERGFNVLDILYPSATATTHLLNNNQSSVQAEGSDSSLHV